MAVPFLPDELWVVLAKNLDARTLSRLKRLQRRFCLIIVEEGARRSLGAHPAYVQAWVPRRSTDRWLTLLHEAEELSKPIAFNWYRNGMVVENELGGASKLRSMQSSGPYPFDPQVYPPFAVCHNVVMMRAGTFFMEFDICKVGPGLESASVGLVAANFNPTASNGAHNLHGVWTSTVGPMLSLGDGSLPILPYDNGEWPGKDDVVEAKSGDLLGLLLDLDQGSLAVYRNGVRIGLAMPPLGPTATQNLRWAALVGYDAEVQITGPKMPPIVSAEAMERDKNQWDCEEWHWRLEEVFDKDRDLGIAQGWWSSLNWRPYESDDD